MVFLIILIDIIVRAITFVVIIKVIISYFLSPYHPFRETIDRIVAPMLEPIRRVMPPTGMMDFSPLVLLLLVQLIGSLIRSILVSL